MGFVDAKIEEICRNNLPFVFQLWTLDPEGIFLSNPMESPMFYP
jgi:hypothetical protein